MKEQTVISESQKSMVAELNISYILLIRELVSESLDKAKLVTGLRSETLKLIASIPIARLTKVCSFPLLLSGLQNNVNLLQSLQEVIPPEEEKVNIIKHLTEMAA